MCEEEVEHEEDFRDAFDIDWQFTSIKYWGKFVFVFFFCSAQKYAAKNVVRPPRYIDE